MASEQQEKISVIVPIYKVEQYLTRCVDSILGQTYQNLEVILVDDGSPDRCGEICDEYQSKDSRVRVIHKENGGLSSARNAGLDIATGEYVGFIDSDDRIDPEMYETMVSRMQADHARIVCCGRYDVYGEKTVVGLCPTESKVLDAAGYFSVLFAAKETDVSACDKLYQRELFENIRYPVGEINEDAAVICPLVHSAQTIAMLDRPMYYYYHRENSITTSFSEKQLIISKHAREMADFVKERYPALTREAESYYNKRLITVLTLINTCTPDVRKQFAGVYRELLAELSKRKQYFVDHDRVKYLMLKTGSYRIFNKIYHVVKF